MSAGTAHVPADESDRDAAAYLVFERLRWGGDPVSCPRCASAGRCYLLRPGDGSGRATRTGARGARRLWKCGACRRQFTVLTGTVLEGTRVPLSAWLAVAELVTGTQGAVSTAQVREVTALGAEAVRDALARWAAVDAVVGRRDAPDAS